MRSKQANESELDVMVIEDDLDHGELILDTFREFRITDKVRHFREATSALDYLFRRGEYALPRRSPRPKMILLDLRLPDIDGLEVLRRLKSSEELRPIPIVVLTTSEMLTDVADAYESHVNSYLVKPGGGEEFEDMLRTATAYWLGRHCPFSATRRTGSVSSQEEGEEDE